MKQCVHRRSVAFCLVALWLAAAGALAHINWLGGQDAAARAEQADATRKKAAADEEEEEPPLDASPKKTSGKSAPAKQNAPDERMPSGRNAGETKGDPPTAPVDEPVFDTIFWQDDKGNERKFLAARYPDWLQPPLPDDAKFTFQFYAHGDETDGDLTILGRQVRRIDYYELHMLAQAADDAHVKFDALVEPGRAVDLSALRNEQKDQLERKLIAANAEYESAVQQNLRRGADWSKHVGRPLANALFNFRLGKIDALITASQLPEAQTLCDRLYGELRGAGDERRAALRQRFEAAWLPPAQKALERQDFAAARSSLNSLMSRFPQEPSAAITALKSRLEAEAQSLLEKAEQTADSDRLSALQLVELAESAAPELPQLDEFRRRLGLEYQSLDCAYAALPANFCPLECTLPSERHAAALLFESLTRWTEDERNGPHYACQLADGSAAVMARGRQFRLPQAPPARWSDFNEKRPYLCTAADVGWTIKLLLDKSRPGYSSALGRLLAATDPGASDDPFLVNIRLVRDHWQPMSLMQFPILPKHRFLAGGTHEEWEAFSAAPVGAGPYRLAERNDKRVRFLAHPHYRLPGLPKIREINFHRLEGDDMVEQILQRNVRLAYGLTKTQVERLSQQRHRVHAVRPRSVWFLAPNYRRKALKNQDLRLALAHAIDREAVLNDAFRPQGRRGDHVALSGPFPPDSWASNPQSAAFTAELAKPFAANAQRALGTLSPLKLVYPGADPDAQTACRLIQAQVKTIGLELAPEEVDPADFADRVLRRHDFDLVYWRHDYCDETFQLWSLFDADPAAQAAGGANFMGIVPDEAMSGFFRELSLHKRFSDVRDQMHKIHDHVARSAVVIPLWQLDAYVAVDDLLTGVKLDPDVLFADIEHWELKSP